MVFGPTIMETIMFLEVAHLDFGKYFIKKKKQVLFFKSGDNLDAGTIISKTFIRTDKHSFLRNHENILYKSTKMVSENIDKIFHYGEVNFFKTLKKNKINL